MNYFKEIIQALKELLEAYSRPQILYIREQPRLDVDGSTYWIPVSSCVNRKRRRTRNHWMSAKLYSYQEVELNPIGMWRGIDSWFHTDNPLTKVVQSKGNANGY